MANRRWKDSFRFLRCRKNLEKDQHMKWITLNNMLPPNQPQSLQYNWRFSKKYIELKTLQFKALLPSSYPKFGSLWYAESQRLTQMDNDIKNILKLAKSMSHGNDEIVLKKKSKLIQLVEEFHKQYQSLHLFYKDSKGKGKQDISEEDNASSPSYSDSEESDIYYTPRASIINSGHSSSDRDYVAFKAESPLAEDLREVVKEAFYVEPVSLSSKVEKVNVDGLISEFSLLKEELDEKENEVLYLTKAHHVLKIETSEKIKELDHQVDTLESQLEILHIQNQSLKDTNLVKDFEVKRLCEENLILKDRISELELIIEEKGDEVFAVLKNFDDNEKLLMDSLSFQEGRLELLLSQTGKGSDEILVLQQELGKKSHEMSEFLKLAGSLKEELERKTADGQNMAEEMNSLRIQIQDLEMQMNSLDKPKSIDNEVKQLLLQNEKLYDKIFLLEVELKEKEDKLSNLQSKIEINHDDIKLQQMCDFLQTEKEAETQWEREEGLNRMHLKDIQAKGIINTKIIEDFNIREEEMLGLMQKIKKLENKVGELEKIVIENEEDMQVLKDGKREAIRQLCVWQDYHFSRYDLLKKAFTELIARNQVSAT